MADHYQFCLDEIKQSDVYTPVLFLPANARSHVSAIYAFANEIENIPLKVNEPAAGEIRLQWWRDVISGEREGEARANPVSAALLDTIEKFDLPANGFQRYIDAKLFDLYNDPMPDQTTLEAYLGETESFLLQMSAIINGADNNPDLANACGHAGVGIGIVKLLYRLPIHNARQQIYIPLAILEHNEIGIANWFAGEYSQAHINTIDRFCRSGFEHLEKARAGIRRLPKPQSTAFLPVVVAQEKLNQLSKAQKQDLREISLRVPTLKIQLKVWKSAIVGV